MTLTRFHPERADRRALHLTQRFAASAADVYAAWVHPALVRHWLFATAGRPLLAVRVDPCVGGELFLHDRWRGQELAWRGRFTGLAPAAAVAFSLILPEAPGMPTSVEVTLAPAPAGGCRLALAHAGVPGRCTDAMEARWLGALYGLRETLAAWRRARTGGLAVRAA